MLITRLGFWAPSSPHPPQHSSDFATKLLAEIWTFGQKRHDPFISISTPNTYTQAFQQLIRKPQKALGQNYTWTSYFGQCIFFPQKYFIRLPSTTSESRPHYNHHCSLSSENPDEAFLLSLWRRQFKSSTGWHDNSNTQFSLTICRRDTACGPSRQDCCQGNSRALISHPVISRRTLLCNPGASSF